MATGRTNKAHDGQGQRAGARGVTPGTQDAHGDDAFEAATAALVALDLAGRAARTELSGAPLGLTERDRPADGSRDETDGGSGTSATPSMPPPTSGPGEVAR